MKIHQENGLRYVQTSRRPVKIRTTLYELVETVIDVVGSEKKQTVVDVLLATLREGRANVKVLTN